MNKTDDLVKGQINKINNSNLNYIEKGKKINSIIRKRSDEFILKDLKNLAKDFGLQCSVKANFESNLVIFVLELKGTERAFGEFGIDSKIERIIGTLFSERFMEAFKDITPNLFSYNFSMGKCNE